MMVCFTDQYSIAQRVIVFIRIKWYVMLNLEWSMQFGFTDAVKPCQAS